MKLKEDDEWAADEHEEFLVEEEEEEKDSEHKSGLGFSCEQSRRRTMEKDVAYDIHSNTNDRLVESTDQNASYFVQ